jgi:hypothetical protein
MREAGWFCLILVAHVARLLLQLEKTSVSCGRVQRCDDDTIQMNRCLVYHCKMFEHTLIHLLHLIDLLLCVLLVGIFFLLHTYDQLHQHRFHQINH